MSQQLLQTAYGSFLNTSNLCLIIHKRVLYGVYSRNLQGFQASRSTWGVDVRDYSLVIEKFESDRQADVVTTVIAQAIASGQPLILWDNIIKAAGNQR